MPIKLESYTIECEHCGKQTDFTIAEVPGLSRDIDEEIEEACRVERRETEAQFDGMIDPADHPIHARTMHELAAAIRRGDKAEAELLLERVASDLGAEHVNAVQVARFSREARP